MIGGKDLLCKRITVTGANRTISWGALALLPQGAYFLVAKTNKARTAAAFAVMR